MQKREINFPVGYHNFNKNKLFNFQLNRWHSFGYALYGDMKKAGEKINNFTDWKREMTALAVEAEADDRIMNAAFYYRAAEFFLSANDPDKKRFYNIFLKLFNETFKNDGIIRYEVPYGSAYLPVLNLKSELEPSRGTIVLHGGFDSFIEEFYSWMRYLATNGYDIVAFEGPGQGGAHRKYGLELDFRWERPSAAILDYFGIDDVTWLGISMGGWLCFRSAAFDDRIKRVIASGVAYDYSQFPNLLGRWLMNLFFDRFPDFTNRMTLKKMQKDPLHGWSVGQLMYITGTNTPVSAAKEAFKMNSENVHSDKVKQDVLILTGREDHFIPFKMHKKQAKALTGARSVTERIFTRRGDGQNHCQVGNVELALEVMLDWINKVSE